ncbi:winged helix-turn-helix transcriptional regulator [Hamadaea tsunoensis]|uniref:winged helix-turn-helix transcriptional regulator n=1 Tax=Hamadaea tsunoensis TaxID=53368 RepID=UPI000402391A|nr:helix-turn-helix domain-containing protein [Hamadaea tsunoensis]
MPTIKAPERRSAARAVHLDAVAGCPTHRVLGRLGGRWVSLVLKELALGPRRNGELTRAVPGATQKMLTETLRGLERDGLVGRSAVAGSPAGVAYRLTALGESLLPVMAAVTVWAEEHIAEIDAARSDFDPRR